MVVPLLDLAIVFHCIVFGIFFLLRKGGIGRTNLYLGILLLLLAMISLPFGLKPTHWLAHFPYLTDMEWAAGFFFAPFYLWYVREMIGEKITFNYKEYLLLLPGAIVFLYFGKYYLLSPEAKREYVQLVQTTYLPEYKIGDAIFYPYIQGYFIYVLVLLSKRQKTIALPFLYNYRWLKNYTVLLLCFGFAGLLIFVLQLPQFYIDLLPLASTVIYMTLIYKSLNTPSEKEVNLGITDEKEEPIVAEERHLAIAEAIKKHLLKEKKYRNSNLTLALLSQELGEPSYMVSQTIKVCFQSKFLDLVTEYRIKEAQERLQNMGTSETIEGIAYEVGFSSRASFYRAYKKYTGQNPSASVPWNVIEK